MKVFCTGGSGLLGTALARLFDPIEFFAPPRSDFQLEQKVYPDWLWGYDLAFLCAGTKVFSDNEGNRQAFRSDVDGNIRLARYLIHRGTFVVFVSTDAVEWALHTAYARNRFAVELAIGHELIVGIFRPAKFDYSNVAEVAKACSEVGLGRRQGLTRWPE